MDEFGLVWLSSIWFDGVDFLKYSRSASQLSFTNLFRISFQPVVVTGYIIMVFTVIFIQFYSWRTSAVVGL